MSLQAGIVGLPNIGKSTLFNSLSSTKAQAANFPFCTIEPNLGTITVPDERLIQLADIVQPQKVIPTTIEIYDIAGLVKGASKGEGLGNQFLANIRNVHTIIHIVRCFENPDIVHVYNNVDPIRDKEIIDTELQLKDLESIEKKISRHDKLSKAGNKESGMLMQVYEKAKATLLEGKNLREISFDKESKIYISDLLTIKPVIYICNVDDKSIVNGNAYSQAFIKKVSQENSPVLLLSSQLESEISLLDNYEERILFLQEYGLQEQGSERLIRLTYEALGLITFFTAGEKEVRAWTIKKNGKAPQAAGEIHTDFEKGFIRAEVISFKDYIAYKSESACRENGKLSIQGKDYEVQDGDIIHFRFNV